MEMKYIEISDYPSFGEEKITSVPERLTDDFFPTQKNTSSNSKKSNLVPILDHVYKDVKTSSRHKGNKVVALMTTLYFSLADEISDTIDELTIIRDAAIKQYKNDAAAENAYILDPYADYVQEAMDATFFKIVLGGTKML